MFLVLSPRFNGLTASFTFSVDWKKLLAKQIQTPFKPNIKSAVDCPNVDEVFTFEDPVDTIVEEPKIPQTVQNHLSTSDTPTRTTCTSVLTESPCRSEGE
jgi:hypothetical protein